MIARVWRGHTRAEDASKYGAFLEAKGFGDYRSTPGNTPVIPRSPSTALRAGSAPRDPVLDSGLSRSSPGSLAEPALSEVEGLGMTG
jgi:hypothetical protein